MDNVVASLNQCEEEIDGAIKFVQGGYYTVGKQFAQIKDAKLWEQAREYYGSFDEYCKKRWGMVRRRVYQIIDAALVVDNLCTDVHSLSTTKYEIPKTEGTARALTKYKKEPNKVRAIWDEVCSRAENDNKEITAPYIKQIAKELYPPKIGKKEVINPENITIILGNAEHLSLEAESIDVIITSPPYNMGSGSWPMGGSASGNPDEESRTPRGDGIGYGDDMPEPEYQAWQVRCISEWYRVAKEGASLFYNHKVRQRKGAIIHPMDWLRDNDNPWIIRQEIIWDRGSTHNHSKTLFWPHDERIYWMTKGSPTIPDEGIGAPNIWSFHGPVPNTWHPAPFAEELPERCLKAIGRPGIVVLDPFGGSMTTCRVAASMGYRAIGIDISPEYIEKAKSV